MTVVVEILTTDGINFSAKSAKEPGIFCAIDFDWMPKANTNIRKIVFILIFNILTLHIINNNKANYSKD